MPDDFVAALVVVADGSRKLIPTRVVLVAMEASNDL
jgi:hypothetical protein